MSVQATCPSLNEILSELLPRLEDLQVQTSSGASRNSIYHVNIVIYGKARRGKTELANSLAANINQAYGSSRVHVAYEVTNLENALEHGWGSGRLVQVLVVDDLTLAEHAPETYQRYFRIGHIMEEKTGERNGLVVTILIVHRFFSLPKELRADIDLLIAKSVSTNPSDANLLRSFLGEQLVAELSAQARRRDVFAYYLSPTQRGITTFQPYETNYLPRRPNSLSASEVEDESLLSPSDARIIRDIAGGRDTVSLLLKEVGWSKPALRDEVGRLAGEGYVAVEGWRRRLRITPKAYDRVPGIPSRLASGRGKSKPKTTRFDVSWWLSFKLVFGALLGLFLGWLLISGLAGLIYWAAYTYMIQPYVPTSLLPWIPFHNPAVDFGLGVLSGTWLFLKLNPAMFLTQLTRK